jgi:hypothetical protein
MLVLFALSGTRRDRMIKKKASLKKWKIALARIAVSFSASVLADSIR